MLKKENAIRLEPAQSNCQSYEKLNEFLTCSFNCLSLFSFFFILFSLFLLPLKGLKLLRISCLFDRN